MQFLFVLFQQNKTFTRLRKVVGPGSRVVELLISILKVEGSNPATCNDNLLMFVIR